jgi:ferredoxin
VTRYDDDNQPYIDGGHCDYVCGYCASPCPVGSEVTNLPVRRTEFANLPIQSSRFKLPCPFSFFFQVSLYVRVFLCLSRACLDKNHHRFSKTFHRPKEKQNRFVFVSSFAAQEIAVDRSIYAFTCGGCPLGRTDLDLDAFTPCSECLAGQYAPIPNICEVWKTPLLAPIYMLLKTINLPRQAPDKHRDNAGTNERSVFRNRTACRATATTTR